MDVYLDTGQTPAFSTGILFSNFARTGVVQSFRAGVQTAGAWTIFVDDIAAGSGFNLLGPVSSAQTASAAFVGGGTLDVGPVIEHPTTVGFVGAGSLAVSPDVQHPASAGFVGGGSL